MTQPCTHRAVSTRYKGQRPSNAFAALPLSEIQLAAPTLRSHTLHRPRLTAHLDHGNGQRVTTIVAPAGYGKTIAAADWLASSTGLDATHGGSGRAAWLTLTAAENDPIRFWRYAVAALERVQPAFHTASWNMRTTSTIDMLQVALLNDMAHAPDDLTLILDDYNLITTDAIHHSLAFLIDHAPPQFHLMLLSRSEPPLPMARWRASDELAELQAADLRFTDIETNALINKQLGLNVAPDLVAMLHDRTAGWATALRLVAHAIGTTRDAYGTVVHLSGAQHDIRTYLEDEVLSHQPPEIRAFLLMTSVADWLSVEVCDAIRSAFDRAWSAATDSATHAPAPTSAPLSSADLLEHVERAGLFLHPIDPERHSYRYHPLFAQMLRYRLHQGISRYGRSDPPQHRYPVPTRRTVPQQWC